MKSFDMTALEVALTYIARGWNPVPIPFRAKRPLEDGWQHRVIDAEGAPRHFNGAQMNIGVVLGSSSHGLTDVDLDCNEARAIAPYILPPTKAIFGRTSERAAHWLYQTNLAATHDNAVYNFDDPKTNERLLELRMGGGGKGAQTVFPGSTHKDTGEPISWDEDGEPATVTDLYQRVRSLAAYCLLARYWPQASGARHDYALTIGGFLSRCGKSSEEVKVAVEAIARAARDEEWKDRCDAAKDAAAAHAAGKNAYGLNGLRNLFGQDVADKVAEWLEYRGADERASGSTGGDSNNNDPGILKSARASTFELTAIRWLWPHRFALGKLGILAGLPDEGKGQILADMAARVTGALEWPCNEGRAPQGNVIQLTAEDDPSDTVVPRLIAAGADLECVEIVSMVRTGAKDRMFSLLTDLPLLRRKVADVGNVVMIQIDPISAYLGIGKIDSFRTTDVRAVLGPLVDLAAELRVAVIGVMHFNKKTDVTNALLRISDSLAFGAAARHVYAVVNDPENKRKLFVRAKNNLAPDTQALAYSFGLREVGQDRQTGTPIWAPHILWHPHHVDVTATEAMAAANETKAPAARDSAKKFLSDLLANGPVAKRDIEEAAEANCISSRTLERAKAELGIIAKKDGPNGSWTWRLPPAAKHWSD
jgi:hypothetical protein